MRYPYTLPALFILLLATSATANDLVKGIVVDIKKDRFEVKDDAGKVVTVRIDEKLLAGKGNNVVYPHHFKQLAMGQEVRLYTHKEKGKEVCYMLLIKKPYVPSDLPKKMTAPPPGGRAPKP